MNKRRQPKKRGLVLKKWIRYWMAPMVKSSLLNANCSWNSACKLSRRIAILRMLLPVKIGLKSSRWSKKNFWRSKEKCVQTLQPKWKQITSSWSMQAKMSGHYWEQWLKWAVSKKNLTQSRKHSSESMSKTTTARCHLMRYLALPRNQEYSRKRKLRLLNRINKPSFRLH